MTMRKRYYLYKRGHSFYAEDSETKQRESLHTGSKIEAEKLLHAKNDAARLPVINIAIAKAYLVGADPKLVNRAWSSVMEEFVSRGGRDSTRIRRQRALQSKPFQLLRNKKLVETTGDDLRAVLRAGGVFTNHFLRCLHNLAVGLGWLPWPVIPPKLWPQAPSKDKRGITAEEHQTIIQSERNSERRAYYELLWAIGASQTDAANLSTDNIDWTTMTLTYVRQKTGEVSSMTIGHQLETLLKQLPAQGRLFPKITLMRDKDRAAEFRRRCRLLKIEGVSLHSYRYAWAERAKTAGYPERFAQQALGHNSKAVHRAYARKAQVKLPSLEEYENKIVQMPKEKAVV